MGCTRDWERLRVLCVEKNQKKTKKKGISISFFSEGREKIEIALRRYIGGITQSAMSYIQPEDILYLRMTIQSLKLEIGTLKEVNMGMNKDMVGLKHRYNALEDAVVSDLDMIKGLETQNMQQERQIIILKNLCIKLQCEHEGNMRSVKTMEKRVDEFVDMDPQVLAEALAMKQLDETATYTTELLLNDGIWN
jgi:hypothetical protein